MSKVVNRSKRALDNKALGVSEGIVHCHVRRLRFSHFTFPLNLSLVLENLGREGRVGMDGIKVIGTCALELIPISSGEKTSCEMRIMVP